MVLALRTWHDRPHVDIDVVIGMTDACAVLALAAFTARGARAALILLLVLTALRLAYARWNGAPLAGAIPDLAAAAFYVRALPRF